MFEWLQHQITLLVASPLYPFWKAMNDGNARFFWIYILTGLVLTGLLYWRDREAAPTARMLFKRETWTSVSAQNDYIIVLLAAVLRLTILSWAFLNYNTIAIWVASALRGIGVEGQVNDSWAVIMGLALTVTLFVVDDFIKFFGHWLMHAVPEFWEFHKVHHSAEHLNFATAERLHPAEVVFTSFLGALSIGLVNGVFIALFGDTLTVETVFGANIFLVAFNIFGGVLRHSPVWLSFGPTLERYLISPAMHQIHHSDKVEHFDKNMGGSLAIWDRLFGTHYIPKGREVEAFGIGEETTDFRKLGVIYFRPFTNSYEMVRARLGWDRRSPDFKEPNTPTA
jgi:sterol desaturase/sphingolipid hydroxylase (fatty acid hydroxylase superfamily)